MPATHRSLPSNITIPGYEAYQVRIVRGEYEYSATFAWSRYASKELALQEAVSWRDLMLVQLPEAASGRSGFRRAPMARKRSHGRVGVTRYQKIDRRRLGNPVYLVYGVNWTDDDGRAKVKQFQAGRIGMFDWQHELHTSLTAEAFRTEWEFCRSIGKTFDPDRYCSWAEVEMYPFRPPTHESPRSGG